MNKKRKIELTQPEINDILTLLYSNKEEGSYYGTQRHWWNRHARIIEELTKVDET